MESESRTRHRRGLLPALTVNDVAALVGALLVFTSAVVAWRADVAAGDASSYDRQGIIEKLRFEGDAARAETDARTEARTFDRYALARLEQFAQAKLARVDTAARVEAVAQRRVADRLAHTFPREFVREAGPSQDHYTTANLDVAARTADLLRARDVRDDSARLYRLAAEAKTRRDQLLGAGLLLVVGIAATTAGQGTSDRRFAIASVVVGGCAAVSAAAVLTLVGL